MNYFAKLKRVIMMFKNWKTDKDTIQYILSKGGFSFLFRMLTMVFSFISMWFITNFYGEAVYGNYTVSLTVLQILTMVFALGIPNAFIGLFHGINTGKMLVMV